MQKYPSFSSAHASQQKKKFYQFSSFQKELFEFQIFMDVIIYQRDARLDSNHILKGCIDMNHW